MVFAGYLKDSYGPSSREEKGRFFSSILKKVSLKGGILVGSEDFFRMGSHGGGVCRRWNCFSRKTELNRIVDLLRSPFLRRGGFGSNPE